MKILIVDDNQMVASYLRILLEIEGHEVKSAGNGPEGYLVYLQFHPELVITDIQMPGESGFELMDQIRKEDPTIKVIYMSGDLGRFRSALEAEKGKYSIDYLAKPFSRENLIGRLSGFLS